MYLRWDGSMPNFHAEQSVVFYYRVVTKNEEVQVFKDVSRWLSAVSRCTVSCFWKTNKKEKKKQMNNSTWLSFFFLSSLNAERRLHFSIAITAATFWLNRLSFLWPLKTALPEWFIRTGAVSVVILCAYQPPLFTFALNYQKSSTCTQSH